MRTVRTREHENRELDKILEELHVSVSERKNIADVNGMFVNLFNVFVNFSCLLQGAV